MAVTAILMAVSDSIEPAKLRSFSVGVRRRTNHSSMFWSVLPIELRSAKCLTIKPTPVHSSVIPT